MAKGDRVGALYYEVILDPRGFARGATRVKSEQDVMARAVSETTSKLDRLQAELDAIGMLAVKGTEEHRKVLAKYQRQVISQMEAEQDAIAETAKQEHFAQVRQTKNLRAKRTAMEKFQILYRRNGLAATKWANMVGKGSGQMAGNLAMAAGLSPQLQGLARSLGPLGVKLVVIAGLALAAYKAIAKMISVADRFKQMEIELRAAMGGSQALTDSMTRSMREYAKMTAYSTEQMVQFAIAMKSMGVSSHAIEDSVSLIGNLAKGDSEKLKRIGKAYTDVLAKGRLMAQEANQFAENGVGIWIALSETMDVSVAKAREMTEAGEVNLGHVRAALEFIQKRDGLEEVNKQRLDTVAGQWDIMAETMTNILAILGEPFRKALVDIMKHMNDALAWGESAVETVKPYIQALELVGSELDSITGIFKTWKKFFDWRAKDEDEMIARLKEQNAENKRRLRVIREEEEAQQKKFEDLKREQTERMMTAEALAKLKWEEKLAEAAITDEQRAQLVLAKEKADAFEKNAKAQEDYMKRQEETAKAVAQAEKEKKDLLAHEAQAKRDNFNDAWKEIDARNKLAQDEVKKHMKWVDTATQAIDEENDKTMNTFGAAAGGSGPQGGGSSFNAGSTGEYEFLRQMELQARKDKKEEELSVDRNKRLQDIYNVLSSNLKATEVDRADDVADIKFMYGI